MTLGKRIRLKRLFSHPSGRLCSVAVDHFAGYHQGLHPGLASLEVTLAAIVAGRPNAVTMHKGVALGYWEPHAGVVPLIVQSIAARPDDTADELVAIPEDAIRLGADAFATCAFLRGPTEAAHLRRVADLVRQAETWELPLISHTYPRRFADGTVEISYTPEDIEWAVRCGIEMGVDVIKVPYCGDIASYAEIVRNCPVPVVAAGGPQTATLMDALATAVDVVRSGARGMTVGRNIWGFPEITKAVEMFKAVIQDGMSVEQVMATVGAAA